MYVFISVLIFIICVLLILAVLVQDSKGGGLASNFSASNQVMGVRKTADFLEKTTWTLVIALVAFSLFSIIFTPKVSEKASNPMQELIQPSQGQAETGSTPDTE